MKTIALMTCAVALGIFAVACAGSDESADDGSSAAAAASAATPAIHPGTYLLASEGLSATLTVQSATTKTVTYTLSVFHDDDSAYASLGNRSAAAWTNGGFQDAIDVKCIISLASAGQNIALSVKGNCSQHGLGAFALGAGTYTKGELHCGLGTTYDAQSARCAGSGGINDPADTHGCAPGTTYDADSARCAGSGGQNDPLDTGDHGCAPGTVYDPDSARCAGSGGKNDPSDQ
jgi:hypothetical protein